MAKVVGLGHVGIYVRDVDRMVNFYRDFLGMTITMRRKGDGGVWLSADPARADHEIVLIPGRPSEENPHLVNQISLRVATLDDLRAIYRTIKEAGYRIDQVVNHGNAIGCYFFDPEGNRTEVFWVTSRATWVPVAVPIDIDQPDEAVMAEVDRVWKPLRDVWIGGQLEESVGAPV